VRVEIHAFNPSDKPVVREVWANVFYKLISEYQTPPYGHELMHVSYEVKDYSRWLTIWGYGHAHMARFTRRRISGAGGRGDTDAPGSRRARTRRCTALKGNIFRGPVRVPQSARLTRLHSGSTGIS